MQLKQTTNNGTASSVSALPLYDAEAVRQMLARAAEIEIEAETQAQSKEAPLSAAQIEALGQELGISAAAVRQSLDEVARVQYPVQRHRQASHNDQIGSVVKAVVPGLLYGFVMCVLFTFIGEDFLRTRASAAPQQLLFLCGCVMPAVLAFIVGWQRRDYRLGVLAGFVLCLASAAGIAFGTMIAAAGTNWGHYRPGSSWVLYICIALVLGAVGSLCGQAGQRLSRKNNR